MPTTTTSVDDIIAAALEIAGERPHKVPRAELVRMYVEEGKSIPEIAEETELHVSTVRYHLEKAGVYQLDPNFRHRHQQKETCVRGHDLAVHGRPRKGRPETTRECAACCRIRDRESKKRRYQARKESQASQEA